MQAVYPFSPTDGPQNTKISSSGDSRVKEGSSLRFSCETDSYPPPTSYSWYVRDARASVESPSLRLQGSGQTLPLDQLGPADTGCYVCSATNHIASGQNSSSLCINVLCEYDQYVVSVIITKVVNAGAINY